MCINIKPHCLLDFSGCKWGDSIFLSSLLSILKSEAGLRSKGEVFWEVVEAWAPCQDPDDAFVSVPEKLHICQWTQTESPWWQGLRCCCIQLWTKEDTCLAWGLIKAVGSPQGDEKGERFPFHFAKHPLFTDWSDMLRIKLFSSLSHSPKEFFQ